MIEIKLKTGHFLTAEPYQGKVHGRTFPGIQIRVGEKKSQKIVASFPVRRALEVISALQYAIEQSHDLVATGDFYSSREWEHVR